MELYIGVCDDDECMTELLEERSKEILADRYTPIFYKAKSAKELLAYNIPFHIVVLDVQMEETDGVELARELLSRNRSCQILFVSGFLTSVSYVYSVPHAGLILKDQLDEYLPGFLRNAADFAASAARDSLPVQVGKSAQPIKLSDIAYMERNGHWTILTLCDGSTLRTREKLSDLVLRINKSGFCQCHASYAVNLMNVRQLEGQALLLDHNTRVPISRRFQKDFMMAFYSYLGRTTGSRS